LGKPQTCINTTCSKEDEGKKPGKHTYVTQEDLKRKILPKKYVFT